jgi:hypothetical protein
VKVASHSGRKLPLVIYLPLDFSSNISQESLSFIRFIQTYGGKVYANAEKINAKNSRNNRLKEANFGERAISRTLKVSRPTVKQYINQVTDTGLDFATIKEMSDDAL